MTNVPLSNVETGKPLRILMAGRKSKSTTFLQRSSCVCVIGNVTCAASLKVVLQINANGRSGMTNL